MNVPAGGLVNAFFLQKNLPRLFLLPTAFDGAVLSILDSHKEAKSPLDGNLSQESRSGPDQ